MKTGSRISILSVLKSGQAVRFLLCLTIPVYACTIFVSYVTPLGVAGFGFSTTVVSVIMLTNYLISTYAAPTAILLAVGIWILPCMVMGGVTALGLTGRSQGFCNHRAWIKKEEDGMKDTGEKCIHEIKNLLDASFGAGYMEESAIGEHMHSDKSLLYLMHQNEELA